MAFGARPSYTRQYRQNGYDFIALTDHCVERYGYAITDTRQLRSEDFTTLIGAELHPGQIQSGSFWHLLAVGLPLDFETHRPDDSGADVANRAREAGAFVAVPHPNWIALTVEDFETLEAVHAVECYNGPLRPRQRPRLQLALYRPAAAPGTSRRRDRNG